MSGFDFLVLGGRGQAGGVNDKAQGRSKTKRLATAAVLALCSVGLAFADGMPPFGSDDDAAYAAKIWAAMESLNLAGDNAICALPYEGTDPHGMMLETFYTKATIDGHTGDLVVKRNYGPAGVSVEEVQADPAKHLGAITVMFRREAGFDPEDQDWFWVKFLPDGSLDKNPKGMRLAGKVAKGADKGCIACHSGAGGDDFLFTTDAIRMR
ncbi:cytochrome P460 family protein [Jhaorihella thermophila]|uniref:Cytochrome P460 n=1 Tax=Jhaorihella thermophila TaxID=488547 RepID=A0A1H5Y2L1_9RHOB|nr:cytochrome P460 family protein [Jhaorihella thermophila]SEG18244.1 Cytochrome P460 [Jhaorihella thermophila]